MHHNEQQNQRREKDVRMHKWLKKKPIGLTPRTLLFLFHVKPKVNGEKRRYVSVTNVTDT